MDQTILVTVIPVISDEFNALEDMGWWAAVYLLALSSFQLLYGKLYSLFPIKFVYLAAIATFEVGCFVCTTAPDPVALIISRAVAGLKAAGIFSDGILITTKLIPLARRAAYLGVMLGAFGLAAVIGPFVGDVVVDRATWRRCFSINLPLGVVTIVLCALFAHTLPPAEPKVQSLGFFGKCLQLDLPETLIMATSVICLLIALKWGGVVYP